MTLNKERYYLFLVLLTAILMVYLRFGDFFYPPYNRVIEPWGDGFKAYAVIDYHAKHDSTYTHFEGMNYPYGEHIVPAATQPLLSNTIKFVSRNVIDITDWTIAIVNFSLLIAIVLSIVLLYLLLRKFGAAHWYSLLVAIGLSFLAPQLLRFAAHYGLAHLEVLPLLLYLLLLWEERPRWQIGALISLTIFGYALIHFYFFGILIVTLSMYFLCRFLWQKGWKQLPFYLFHYSVMIVPPLLFFTIWLKFSDTITDRTAVPWGFFYFKSQWEGVYTSLFMPHWRWIDQIGIMIAPVREEGQAYIGLVAVFGVLVLLGRWLKNRLSKSFIPDTTPHLLYLSTLFVSSFILLLLAMGYPFTFPGMEVFLPILGPFQQFRSIGRFAWVFFYASNISVFVILWHWAKGEDTRRKVVLGLALAVLAFEAYHFATAKTLDLNRIEKMEAPHRYSDIDSIDYSKYQAILPVPYYNVGSDQFWFPMAGTVGQRSLVLSMQTGLPLSACMLTRTSLSQTWKQLQLVQEPYRVPSIFGDYPSQKPLLMAWNEDRSGNYGQLSYSYLLDHAQLLYEEPDLSLYELPLDAYAKNIKNRKRGIEWMIGHNQLYNIDDMLTNDSTAQFVYHSFDDRKADKSYLGNGAVQGIMNEKTTIFEGLIPNQEVGTYFFSIWMYLAEDQNPRTIFHVKQFAPNGYMYRHRAPAAYSNVKIWDDNGWGLVEFRISVLASDAKLEIYCQNENNENRPVYLDELLIWKAGKEVLKETDSLLWHNNRHFLK